MARRVFFSFHYQNDVWRAGQIRNSWVARDREASGFWDAASWEKVKRGGDEAIKNWIEDQLDGTSVTVVLIGSETSERRYVKHEIKRSHALGKAILGIWVHRVKDMSGYVSTKGANPFDQFYIEEDGRKKYLSEIYPAYDWVADDGYENLADWIEDAAQAAGR
ncbi:MAG: TIR domain-containing protein [Betaproteobacteria bacterium]|nr:TIR domain-containing protein [Betaproteobacteria bacterium]